MEKSIQLLLKKENLRGYKKPEYFFNRDLSWLEFNRRVLEEALNPKLPLLDRVKFISIFCSNLDEFYMIRVSGIKEQIRAKIIDPTIDGLTPLRELQEIEKEIRPMLKKISKLFKETILPGLKKNDVQIQNPAELNESEKKRLNEYFYREIYPVLTPLAFDPGRPFPYISNLSISFALLVEKESGIREFARVKIPSILPRLIRIDKIFHPNKKNSHFSAKFIWIDDLIQMNLDILFPGLKVTEAHKFRITRNTDVEIQEDEADDLLEVIEENIRQRKFGSVVRLEVQKSMPQFMLDTLRENLQIAESDTHIIDCPLGLSDIMELYSLPLHDLKEKQYYPVTYQTLEEKENIFAEIKRGDILIHHPYESFNPVIDFIKAASQDPDVLAIKQTLYRVGSNSPVVKALIEAAEMKKQVAVLVELKARFDEENNIYWARELEKVGVHVVYGLVGLKTHSKLTLVVRKESDGVKRYVHLGTGNYNPSTAKIYTDFGLFTSDEDICSDVTEIFNLLTGYSEQKEFRKLFVAPINIREKMLELIEQEIEFAKKGEKARLIFKMNSLVDPVLIAALYEASANGVKIDLIIRGICCLVPQFPSLSENIRVVSIVGRFLEHSRIYYFRAGGRETLYMGSADLMPRNLDRRVETLFPIENEDYKRTLIDSILRIALEDCVKSRVLLPTGKYVFNHGLGKTISLQDWLMDYYSRNQKQASQVLVR